MQYANVHTTQQEKLISGAVASMLHLMFIALLVFGVNWQKKSEPQVNIVDLWSPPAKEPQAVEPPSPPPPPPKPEVRHEVPPKIEPAPPKPVAKPEVAKPDIALKDKVREKVEKEDKERRIVEDKQKEAKKREEAAQAAQKQQQAREAEAQQRAVREQEDAQRKLAEQSVAQRQSQIDKYRKGISDKIRKFVVRPPNLQGNEEAEFDVVLLPDGNVLSAKLKKPSGNAAYDGAVERAINRAQPLPVPQDPALIKAFRELNLKFNAQE